MNASSASREDPRRSYAQVLRTPGVARLVASQAIESTGSLARPLALLLFARQHSGSFADAGFVVASFTAGALISGPLLGRRLDRAGYSQPLLALGIVSGLLTAAVVVAGEAGAPTIVLAALAGTGGATNPPVVAALRSLWKSTLGDSAELHAAYATITMLNEIGFFAGPLLAGAAIALFSPAVALLVAAAMVLLGTIAFALAPAARAARPEPGPRPASPVRSAGVRLLLATALAFGVVFGVIDVVLPAFAVEHGEPGAGGLLLAALSPGIVAGGYVYGRRVPTRAPGDLYWMFSLLAAAGLVPLVVADSIPVLLALTVVAGAAFAPVTTVRWALVDVVAASKQAVEMTSWLTSASLAGGAAGSAVGGVIIQHGSTATGLWAAVAGTATAGAIALLGRRWLTTPARRPLGSTCE